VERTDYIYDSDTECERLEKQAILEGIERYLRFLPVPEGGRVLDAGCGSGSMTRLLASRNPKAHIVGVDFNPRFIAYAGNRAAAEGLTNTSFEQGDVQDLSFNDGGFDVVWSHLVLYFLPDPARAIAEFRRVLRPGGRLVIALTDRTFLNNHPEDPSLQPRLNKVIHGIADVDLSRRLPGMLREAGFKDIICEIETDRLYHVIGSATPAQRENIVIALTSGMARLAGILGSREEAERFLTDLLAYIDRADTDSFNTLWITMATA
jgi:SAM-dependent methyltransferase